MNWRFAVLLALVALASTVQAQYCTYADADSNGNDITSFNVKDLAECKVKCSNDADCKCAAFWERPGQPNRCYTKRAPCNTAAITDRMGFDFVVKGACSSPPSTPMGNQIAIKCNGGYSNLDLASGSFDIGSGSAANPEACEDACAAYEKNGVQCVCAVFNSNNKMCYFKSKQCLSGTKSMVSGVSTVFGQCGVASPRSTPPSTSPSTGAERSCPNLMKEIPFARADKVLTSRYGNKATLNYREGTNLCGGGNLKMTMHVWNGKSGSACKTCPGAVCKIWAPSPGGHYNDNCSMTSTADEDGRIVFTTPMAGNESKVGWGDDSNPHWHFECKGCDGGVFINKFYHKQPDTSMLKYLPDSTMVAKNGVIDITLRGSES